MLKATAKARLVINTQARLEPKLSDQEMEDLLAAYARKDTQGQLPDNPAWVGTWDIRAATRQAWLIKAGKVAGEVNFQADGTAYSLSDMHAHCMAMASKYGSVGSMAISPGA